MDFVFAFKTALQIAELISGRKTTAAKVTAHFQQRIDRFNPSLNAVIWRDFQTAADQAAAIDNHFEEKHGSKEFARLGFDTVSPFLGVPFLYKDLTDVVGQPSTLGSVAFRNRQGRLESSTVERLRQAGLICLGRTNTPEFGTIPVTENKLFGNTSNPWDTERSAGGSSGGAAAAVAAGLVPIAHGSDGGGSIRIPASCCHLVGLKPSRGRVPKGPPVSDVLHGLATDGCLAQDIRDTAAFLDLVARPDYEAWYSAPCNAQSYLEASEQTPGTLRIAVDLTPPIDVPVADTCEEAVHIVADALRNIGHTVNIGGPRWRDWPGDLRTDFMTVWAAGAAYWPPLPSPNDNRHEGATGAHPETVKIESHNRHLRKQGRMTDSISYVQTLGQLQAFSRWTVEHWSRDFDLLLSPTLAQPPCLHGWLFSGPTESFEEIIERGFRFAPFTGWCNITGQPAINIPLFINRDGLPIGVQLVAAPFREDLLLQVGRQLEEWRGPLARPPNYCSDEVP